jgi:hypothetical protein
MQTQTLTLCLYIAGALHLGLICAGALMPQTVGLREHVACLPPFIRRLFWVYYCFIGLCLVGFGTLTLAFAETLAGGSGLARAFSAFLATFWTLRFLAAVFVFDVKPYLTSRLLRVGYSVTNIVFLYLPIVYAWAALQKTVI